MNTDALPQPNVNTGGRLVGVAPTDGNQADGERAGIRLRQHERIPLHTPTPVDPHATDTVNKDVRDGRVGQQRTEHTELLVPGPGRATGLSGNEGGCIHGATLKTRRMPGRP